VLDFGELVVFEVVHRVADEVVRVDAADLVDEEPGLLSVDLHCWAEDGGLCCGRGGDDRGDTPGHGTRAEHQTQAPAALLVSAFRRTQIHSVDRAANHHRRVLGTVLQLTDLGEVPAATNSKSPPR